MGRTSTRSRSSRGLNTAERPMRFAARSLTRSRSHRLVCRSSWARLRVRRCSRCAELSTQFPIHAYPRALQLCRSFPSLAALNGSLQHPLVGCGRLPRRDAMHAACASAYAGWIATVSRWRKSAKPPRSPRRRRRSGNVILVAPPPAGGGALHKKGPDTCGAGTLGPCNALRPVPFVAEVPILEDVPLRLVEQTVDALVPF